MARSRVRVANTLVTVPLDSELEELGTLGGVD